MLAGRAAGDGVIQDAYDWVPNESGDQEERISMHFETHQSVIDDLEARILTIRDSL